MADDLNTALGNWVSAIAGKIGNDPDRGAALSVGLLMRRSDAPTATGGEIVHEQIYICIVVVRSGL
jgi:hypothetical protein